MDFRLESTAVENRQADGQLARMRTANAELEASLERARAEISQLMDQLRVLSMLPLCTLLFAYSL